MSLTFSSKTIEKYFRFLYHLDLKSKKKLIISLTESIEVKEDKNIDLKSLFGAWEDMREAEEIIKAIRDSRVDNNNFAGL